MKRIILTFGIAALAASVFLTQEKPALWTSLTPAPVTQTTLPPADATTAIGPVAGPVEGAMRPERLSLHPELVDTKLTTEFAHAPEWVQVAARALMSGQDMTPIVNVEDLAIPYTSDTPTLDQPSTLVRTALEFDRMDAITAMLTAGLDPNVDQHIILWKTLEQWTPGTADQHTATLMAYINAGGAVNIAHEEGFSAIELAATVSSDVVLLLMAYDASPWTHPQGLGSGLTERLSLHVNVPFVLDMLDHISASPHIAPADTRALENTIGNLVDHYDALIKNGAEPGVKDGVPTGEIHPTIQQIATIVMRLSTLDNAPWSYIPQEFVDMKGANLLTAHTDLN